MDDSDEYFDDSFVLDEAALALIQATEERFGASLSQAHPTRSAPQAPPSPPPAKKLKTTHDSVDHRASAQLGIRRMESFDLNPEIRVGPDGNYVVSTQSKTSSHAARSDGSSGLVHPDSSHIHAELASIRAQLAEVNAANAVIQRSLREAQDAQLVKAGEVAILRQTIDKTNKEHADAIAKAKAEKVAHEKIKAELQAKLKEETERMATRLVFQQHEMETSTRKPSWGSVRSRRIVEDPFVAGSALAATLTRAPGQFRTPATNHPVSLEKNDKDQYVGDSGPLSSPTSRYKATRPDENALQLRRIVFTHVAPRNDALTLHILLSTPIPPETPHMERHAYTTACQVILETCGARHGHTQYSDDSEWEANVLHKVADAFVTVGGVLSRTGCIAPLTALLDLLLLLTLYIPASLSAFLGPPVAGQLDLDRRSRLLPMLCDVVRDHLVPPKPNLNVADNIEGNENMRATLAMAVVELMQSLCWNVTHDLIDQLSVLPRQPQVFAILLDPAQTPELIARTLQLLVLLAAHQELIQYLLSSYESDTANRGQAFLSRDPLRLSLLDKLCYYLVELAVEESYRIRRLVVTLISLIADSNEARTILVDSVILAPSLVIFIAKLSGLMWEDDFAIMDSSKLAKLTVDMLYSSVNLFHHLIFVLDLSSVLGRKLVDATRLPGPFNGVTHMFIVTFGRLSWAGSPDWLDEECKDRCEVIAELAMEIIESVVAGPECDGLWAVWHEAEVTDEEFEAWKIQID
ncbi:hypothetical protein JB92DRAFT_2983879 [Gautieria morchelliformis]|nr:hypothetical protein JB92DRAFT_2983879 [Gautieria morchelliformis]